MGVLYFPIVASLDLKYDGVNQFVKNYTWESFFAKGFFRNVQKDSKLIQVNSVASFDQNLQNWPANRNRIGRFMWQAELELLSNTGSVIQASRVDFENDSNFCAWGLYRGPFLYLSNFQSTIDPFCCWIAGFQFRKFQVTFDNEVDLGTVVNQGIRLFFNVTFVFESE